MKWNAWTQKSRWTGMLISGLCALLFVPMQAQAEKGKKSQSWAVRAMKLSTKQKLKLVGKVVLEARQIHNKMIEKLKEARDKKDLLAVDCLGEKFSRAQALMFLMENKRSEFLKSTAQSKTEQANTYFTQLMQAHGNLKNVDVEASQCRGKAGTYSGKTRVDFEIPPKITSRDPTLPPWKEPIIYRPSNASNPY